MQQAVNVMGRQTHRTNIIYNLSDNEQVFAETPAHHHWYSKSLRILGNLRKDHWGIGMSDEDQKMIFEKFYTEFPLAIPHKKGLWPGLELRQSYGSCSKR